MWYDVVGLDMVIKALYRKMSAVLSLTGTYEALHLRINACKGAKVLANNILK